MVERPVWMISHGMTQQQERSETSDQANKQEVLHTSVGARCSESQDQNSWSRVIYHAFVLCPYRPRDPPLPSRVCAINTLLNETTSRS
jgi:hypothetical protein